MEEVEPSVGVSIYEEKKIKGQKPADKLYEPSISSIDSQHASINSKYSLSKDGGAFKRKGRSGAFRLSKKEYTKIIETQDIRSQIKANQAQ